jgi:hypothetical protein
MVKNNLIFSFLGVVILGVIIGLAIGRHQSSDEIAIQLAENKRLRKENSKKEVALWELRRGLAHERKNFLSEINKSVHRYDSLETVSRSRQVKLLLEIRRLKNSTVKELEDEAERIYLSANTIQ